MQGLLDLIDLSPQSFENFVVGKNQSLIKKIDFFMAFVKNILINNESKTNKNKTNKTNLTNNLYLWGESGSGKSHLLQALVHKLPSSKNLCFTNIDNLIESNINNEHRLIIVDTLQDEISADKNLILFSLLRKAENGDVFLILAGNLSPTQLKLPEEIRTRIAKMEAYQVQRLTDDEKLQAMFSHANRRNFLLDKKVALFFINNFPRDMRILISLIDSFDEYSLKNKTPATLAMAKKMINNKFIVF